MAPVAVGTAVLTDLRVSLSARADFRCSCCATASAEVPQGVLGTNEVVTVVAAFVRLGVRRVRLTSADPGSRPDLLHLIEAIRGVPGIDDVTLTTDGRHLSVLASRYRAAGVSQLCVRTETLDPACLRRVAGRAASVANLVSGVAAAARAGFTSLKLDTVVIRDVNDGELARLVRFAWRHGAVPRLIELMPYGRGDPVTVAEMKQALRQQGVRLTPDAARGWGPGECWRGETDDGPLRLEGPIRFVGPMSLDRCCGCNRVRVGPDGTLRACLARPMETRLAPLLRRGAGLADLLPRIAAALETRSAFLRCLEGGRMGST